MAVIYDSKRPVLSLFRFYGTLWPSLLTDPCFYFLIVVNLLFIILRMTGAVSKSRVPIVPQASLGIVSSLVSFSMVFLLNKVMTRFHEEIMMMIRLGGTVVNLVSLATSSYEADGKEITDEEAQLRLDEIARFGNACSHLCFYGVARFTTYDYLEVSDMLTREEIKLIKEYPGKKTNLVCAWLQDSIESARRRGLLQQKRELVASVLALKSNATMIQDYRRFPIPLGYYHCVTISLYSWLFLLAYSTPFLAPEGNVYGTWVSFAVYLVILIAFLGIHIVANAHADPWGRDSSDIDVLTELNGTVKQSKAIINSRFHPSYNTLSDRKEFTATHFWEAPTIMTADENSSISDPAICDILAKLRMKRVSQRLRAKGKTELGELIQKRQNPSKIAAVRENHEAELVRKATNEKIEKEAKLGVGTSIMALDV